MNTIFVFREQGLNLLNKLTIILAPSNAYLQGNQIDCKTSFKKYDVFSKDYAIQFRQNKNYAEPFPKLIWVTLDHLMLIESLHQTVFSACNIVLGDKGSCIASRLQWQKQENRNTLSSLFK